MSRFKRKPAPDALYRPGDIVLFRREGTGGGYHYKVVFILDVWRVKTIRYQIIEMQKWGPRGKWSRASIENITERKMLHQWTLQEGRRWEEVDRDLGFLAVNGSPATLIENLFKNDKLKRERKAKLASAKKRVEALEEEIKALDRAEELLEERYEGANS